MQKTISYLKYRHRQRELNLKVIGITFSFNRDLFPLCKIIFTTCNNEKQILFLTNFYILNDSFDENKQAYISKGESRLKKDFNLQIHLHKPFFEATDF